MTSDPRFRVPLVLLVAVLVHTAVTSRVTVLGARPDVLLLVPIAAGLAGGRSRGAALGFAAGLAADVFLTSPMALSALVYSLVGYAVGLIQGGLLALSPLFTVLTALGASAAGVLLYALAAGVLGQALVVGRLPVVVLVVALVNALLGPPALRAMRWAMGSARLGRWQPSIQP